MLNLIIIYSFSKIGNSRVVGNLFSETMIHDLLESHNFLKFGQSVNFHWDNQWNLTDLQ